MKPRPVYDENKHGHDWVSQAKYLSEFREEERAWFEGLLANPHVQAVLKIPEEEPIFVLRAQDRHAVEAITEWLLIADANGGLSNDKYNRADADRVAIEAWQIQNPNKVKQPD